MSARARIYITFVIALGAAALILGPSSWEFPNVARFLWFLVLAIPASCLKVSLPGIRFGTMSVLFIFLLGGIVSLNLPETLVIGAVCAIAQSVWHSRFGVRPVQVVFSIATICIAVVATNFSYHATPFLPGPLRLVLAVTTFFVTNTFPIAAVISLTEGESLRHVWSTCYFWCFPYYLVGSAIVAAIARPDGSIEWQSALVAIPLVYVIYRSYQLYLRRVSVEQDRIAADRAHAAETAALHEKTIKALAAAVTANSRLDAVISASPLAIVTLDSSGCINSWNPSAEQIFGWTSQEVIGRELPFASDPADQAVHDLLVRTRRGEAISGFEMSQHRRDGSPFEAAIWTAALPDPDGAPGVLLTIADVSARKRLEEQLRMSQKMEAVGRLAGGVAHDFNNLLTVINGYSSLLLETVRGQPDAASQTSEILAAGTRAAELVSQLLTFSRRQMIKPAPIDINEFVRNVKKLLQRVIGENIELRENLDPAAGWIRADQNQMEGVLLNLASNARDAMPQGGVLTIETAPADVTAEQPVGNIPLEPGEYVRIVIRDTGCGMDAETKQRLFEPFYTTKERGRGTGLGLSSVLGGVEQNGGRILVESEPGNGSEFSLYLPRISAPDSAADDNGRRLNPVPRGSETILLVEDELAVRRMLREALTNAGYRVWEAESGGDAIGKWSDEVSRIHLVITDVLMPGMSGISLIHELRRLRPDMRALFMSGHADDLLEHTLTESAAVLRKPFPPDALIRKVRQILDDTGSRENET